MSRVEWEATLSKLKMARMELTTRADLKIKAIKQILSMSAITPIQQIDIEGVYSLAVELHDIKREMVSNLSDVEKIERELQ